mmetsp:Transcript_30990/g.72403  ORF Transcript_30990/g.72403 Transcript_30990/m.72403 type:complete len:106 (-) Transcript_30990:46-363(-)
MRHGGTNILIILDTLFAGHTFHIVRSWPFYLVAIAWVLFSRVYALAGGLDADGNGFIYGFLDWNKQEVTATLVVVFVIVVFVPVCMFISWGFCKLRKMCISPRPA